jgi:hypothetical protein
VSEDPGRTEAIRAFLQLGSTRNKIVHQNYGAYESPLTLDEVASLHVRALDFVNALPGLLEEFRSDQETAGG